MILYHGTTLDIAKKIKAEGLIPHRESAFNIQRNEEGFDRLRNVPYEKEPLIYLAPDLRMA